MLLRDDCGVKDPHKVIACHLVNLQGGLKNAKTSEKVFSEKKISWRKFSIVLEGEKESWLYIKVQTRVLSICRGVAGPLETHAHNQLKDNCRKESCNHWYSL